MVILELIAKYPRTHEHVRKMFCDLGGTPEAADFFFEGITILRPWHFIRGVEDDLTDGVSQDKLHELHDMINDCFAKREISL